ncbi:MAG TPA: hypothetical protein VFE47_28170 [Tepidisphaeraceae bacterium]|nr:hypothetical protein [Tepidisphaeraceae bacterium]
MGYYMRFFDTSENPLTVQMIQTALRNFDLSYRIDGDSLDTTLHGALYYRSDQYARVEINRPGEVTEPGSVIVGETSAVLPVEIYVDGEGFRIVRSWKTIALSHIVEFSDIETKPGRAKK